MSDINLNKEQREAVEHEGGPLMIIAGAGTGKTAVLTERIKYLLTNNLATPSEILALTFTEKAAQEMEERVDRAMPLGYGQMWISTFHSFCDRVLRQEGLAIGIDTSYNLLTTAETMQFIKDNLFEFKLNYFRPMGNPTKFIGGLLDHFSRLQDEDITPEDYYNWVLIEVENNGLEPRDDVEGLELDKWQELSWAYKTYSKLKLKHSVMDFGDLISYTLKLFRERPNILREYQNRFKYLLVDEYQDTNIAQNELVKLLCLDDSNITVVLDDDQSIYRFRGAAVSNAIQFRDNFPKLRTVTLTRNYRSGQQILDKSYDLIQHNNPERLEIVENVDKKLVSEVSEAGEIRVLHAVREEDEASRVVEEITALTAEKYSYKDCAILVRANSHSEPFIRALQSKGIPYQFLGPAKLFEQKEIIEIISYLKVLYDVTDSLSLYSVFSNPIFGLSGETINKMTNAAKKKNETFYDYCKNHITELELEAETIERISNVIKMIDTHLERSQTESAAKLIYSYLDETGQFERLISPVEMSDQERAENISLLFDKLKAFEMSHDSASVRIVVDWIDMLVNQGESPRAADTDWSEVDAVNILTVHSSKGLEFPVCFLVNLVALRFPSMNRREQIPIPEGIIKEHLSSGDYHIQEERRLFYVGMTRAKEKLYLTAADFYGDGKRAKKLSPFIIEALGDDIARSEEDPSRAKQSLTSKDFEQVPSNNSSFIRKPFHIDYLSYTQISTFQTCPLHYKLKYLVKIPTEPTAPLSFGKSIHEVMRRIYVSRLEGEKLTKNDVIEVFNEEWIADGFTHKKHEQEGKEKGRRYVEEYYDKSYLKGVTPVWIEHPFVVSLKDPDGKGSRLKIGGTIDRVDYSPQTGLEILDYKTGEKVPDQKEVDNNEQLTFYALAVSKLGEHPFDKVIAGDIKLSLYYFEEQRRITTTRTLGQLEDFEKKLFELKGEIENSDFVCSNNYLCQFCEYKAFCSSSLKESNNQ